jgi:hypothetical protein
LWDYSGGLPDTFERFRAKGDERDHKFFEKYAKNHLESSKSQKYHTSVLGVPATFSINHSL